MKLLEAKNLANFEFQRLLKPFGFEISVEISGDWWLELRFVLRARGFQIDMGLPPCRLVETIVPPPNDIISSNDYHYMHRTSQEELARFYREGWETWIHFTAGEVLRDVLTRIRECRH